MKTFSGDQVITVVFLILMVTAQGIRLGPVSISLSTQEKLKVSSIVVPCEDGACSRTLKTIGATKNEKHMVSHKGPADSTSDLQKVSGEEEVKVEDSKKGSPIRSNTELSNEMYPDIIDIAGMDYSSARRKPPIHN